MNVQDIINEFQMGEFSELAIGDSSLTSTYLPQYLLLLQSGLTELHLKFLIKQRQLVIQPIEGKTSYPLKAIHAKTNTSTNTKYILDTVYDPFDWEILQILNTYDENGEEIPLNAPGDVYGVFSNAPTDLLIPAPITSRQITLVCRSNHAKLTGLSSVIDVPPGLQNALLWLVSSRIWATKKDDGAVQKSIQYMQRYVDACDQASMVGSANTLDSIEFGYPELGWR